MFYNTRAYGNVGGLVGASSGGMANCINNANINLNFNGLSHNNFGTIAGIFSGTMINIQNYGSLTIKADFITKIGGLVGVLNFDTINSCINYGCIMRYNFVAYTMNVEGSYMGLICGTSSGTIEKCGAIGFIDYERTKEGLFSYISQVTVGNLVAVSTGIIKQTYNFCQIERVYVQGAITLMAGTLNTADMLQKMFAESFK